MSDSLPPPKLPRPVPLPVPRLVGMVHLRPLPGSTRWLEGVAAGARPSMEAVLDRARADALALVEGGMDGLLVENFGDLPFAPGRVSAETCAAMTLAVAAVLEVAAGYPVGVNVLRNDAQTALAVAGVTGADFIRVNVHTGTMFTDQGILHGTADATLRARAASGLGAPPEGGPPRVGIAADVHVKHATPPSGASLEEAARDARARGLADILVVSGAGTGRPVDRERLARVREAVPGVPLWVGSGVTADTVADLLQVADGVIVGSALQREGRAGGGVEVERVQRFVEAATR
jgi:uncharacterized protein